MMVRIGRRRKMDIFSIGSSSLPIAASTGDTVATLVLKKAMDIQAQSALQLIQALPAVTPNPPNLGNGIDIKV